MSFSQRKFAEWINQLVDRVEVVEAENRDLKIQMNELKEIVHNALMKSNPEYKKKHVLGSMDEFLGKKFGERRP